jgi:xylulose-5-phosphate/fructose-6-phosphate phosphoketolase
MMLLNHTSRYHVAATAVKDAAVHNSRIAVHAHERVSHIMHLAAKDTEYIYANGKGELQVFFFVR